LLRGLLLFLRVSFDRFGCSRIMSGRDTQSGFFSRKGSEVSVFELFKRGKPRGTSELWIVRIFA